MLNLFYKNNPPVEKKNFTIAQILEGSFSDQVFFGGTVTPQKAATFYRDSSAVATAIDTIAREVEGIIPVVELDDGTFSSDHPVLELLNNPNEFEDYREFIGQLIRNYLLNHDAFVFAEGMTIKAPTNLFAINNQVVSIMESQRDNYPYVYNISSGIASGAFNRKSQRNDMRFYDGNMRELYHIHGYSSRTSNTLADSPLQSAALEARQQILGRNHNLKLISNGGRLSMAVILKGEHAPTQEEFKDFKSAVMDDFSGAENAGKVAVYAASDMDIKELGMNNKDMDFGNLDSISRDAIFMRYGIPLPIVSPDRQTFNNFDRAIEDLYDRAVLPYANIIFSGLTKMLRSRYKDDFKRITFNPETISALKGRMLAELKIRKELNLETTNELRQFLPNREDIVGGDTVYQQASLIPVGEDLFKDDEVL